MIESRDDIYVDEPWLLMKWDSENNCVHSVWKGFANSAEFRAALMQGLKAVRDRHATGYVSDTRMIKVIVHEDQRWAQETVIPAMAAAGLRRMAMVIASSGLGKVTVEEIVTLVDNKPILMRTFNAVTPALKWVKEA